LDEAVALGVERFVFTGGEPLIVKDIVKILHYALQLKPCLVLTNGTAPLIKRAHQLQALKAQSQALSFRVSIDYPDEKLHDAERGWGNFKRAIEGLQLLRAAGFQISIARQAKANENVTAITERYQELLVKHGLPIDIEIVPWPEFGRPNSKSANDLPTQLDLDRSPHRTMCATTRMLTKRTDGVRVYACALTDDDPQFDCGSSLSKSLSDSVALIHPRCVQCVRRGVHLGA